MATHRTAGSPAGSSAGPPAGPSVDAELGRLADRQATGALELPGRVGGMFFLAGGRITYVETPGVPSLGVRLIRSGRLGDDDWRAAMALVGGGATIGRVLQERQLVDARELVAVARSIVVDAATVLLGRAQTDERPPRFHPDLSHWAGDTCRVEVGVVLDEVNAGLADVAGARVGAEDTIHLRRTDRSGVVLDPLQWALVSRFEGAQTPRSLSWLCGEQLLGTIRAVSDLVGQGACAVTVPRPRELRRHLAGPGRDMTPGASAGPDPTGPEPGPGPSGSGHPPPVGTPGVDPRGTFPRGLPALPPTPPLSPSPSLPPPPSAPPPSAPSAPSVPARRGTRTPSVTGTAGAAPADGPPLPRRTPGSTPVPPQRHAAVGQLGPRLTPVTGGDGEIYTRLLAGLRRL